MKNTGERRVRKPTSVVRRGARGKGLRKEYLACGLPYLLNGLLRQRAFRFSSCLSVIMALF
jgi:hypothetical protein